MIAPLRVAAAVAFAIAIAPAIGAQQTTRDATRQLTGPGSIAGRVVAGDGTGAPIRRAQVSLTSIDRSVGRTVVSDDGGRFVFTNLPAGRYAIEARKAAYLTAALGATRPGGTGAPVTLNDGQQITDRVISMSRGAVVTGAVRLESGGPAVGVTVAVLYPTMRGETEVLNTPPTRVSATTDDNGVYRIYGLPPGEVVVLATTRERINDGMPEAFIEIGQGEVARAAQLARSEGVSSVNAGDLAFLSTPMRGPVVTFAPVFHPGSTDLGGAARLTLAPGDERAGVDIALRLVPTAMVRGIVTGPDGAPVANAQVRMAGGAEFGTLGGAVAGIGTSATGPDGRFQIGFLIPGHYLLFAASATRAMAAPPPGDHAASAPIALWAMQEVTIAGRNLDLPLQLQPNLTVSGRVVVDSALPAPDVTGVEMRLVPVGNTQVFFGGSAPIARADGSFRMPLLPGKYRMSISTPPASRWVPVSSIVRGQDTLDVGYDVRAGEAVTDWVVTITDRPSELAGTITDGEGRPAADYFIVAFAADRTFWTRPSRRVVQTRTAGDGSYLIKGLPAGQYRIAALTDLESADTIAPAFLESLVAASLPVTIADRQRTTQNLRIGSR